MLKKCFKCEIEKPYSEFYRHAQMGDGHLGKCKECTKADVGENYAMRREQYVEYERKRNLDPERRAKKKIYDDRHRAKHPERAEARSSVHKATKLGKLQKKPCEVCGDTETQAHHTDYSKPLDVQWLCWTHHMEAHGKIACSEWHN